MFTEQELRDMQKLRNEMGDLLPPDLNGDFNIHRWIHGWHGDIAQASQRFRAYIENRKAAHLDDPHFLDHFHSHPIVTRFAPYFSFTIKPLGVNPNDNTVLILQRFQGVDYHVMTKVMTCSQFLSLYFVICEWNLRQVLRCEADTMRKSGLTMIFDLDHFPLLHYANPNSAIYKIFMLCLCLLQDYYCDMLHRLLIVNAPAMVNVVLSIVKRFLNPVTQQKFTTVPHKEDLFKYVHPSVLPVRYGGQARLNTDHIVLGEHVWHMDPESCTMVPKEVADADFFAPRGFSHKVIEHIASKQHLEVRKHVHHGGSMLAWQFVVSAEIKFMVAIIKGDDRIRLTPFWTVITPKLPEEGSVICTEPGVYALVFYHTGSSSHSVKLEYGVDITPH